MSISRRELKPDSEFGIYCIILSILVSIVLYGCQTSPEKHSRWTGDDSLRIVRETALHRSETDGFFRSDPNSPFRKDSTVHYDGIKWFPIDVDYYFQSRLYRYDAPQTVSIFGTKGDERKELRYGYFVLYYRGQKFTINAYKFTPGDEAYAQYKNQLSVWFTDETTGKETYHVGRYLEVGDESPDPAHLYALNFNNAYNPYCAYTPIYSCAIPPKEDHLAFAVRAGEMKYHP